MTESLTLPNTRLPKPEKINIEEMENRIFDGGRAGCCTLKIDQPPADAIVAEINAGDNIISASLK